MTREFKVMAVAGALGLALVTGGCSGGAEGKAGEASKPPVAVEVSPVTAVDMAQSIDVVGQLTPKSTADVKSEFTAVVTEVYVTEWVRVRKGQPLARLDTREGEAAVEGAKAAAMQAEVAETRAQRELERAIKLKEVGLVTQQTLDDARSAREAAAATTAAARAQLRSIETRLDKAVIRAPIDGVVALRGVNVGDRVENMGGDTPMFRIVDNRLFDLTMTVPSTRSAVLKVGQPIEFTTDVVPGKTFTGAVRFINPSVDAGDRSVKVVAEVRNDDESLRGGLFVKGRIVTGTRAGVLQVPRVALMSWDVEQAVAEVFVVSGETVERRSVRIGQTADAAVEVVDGLAAGDKVVTRGGFNLRPGDRVAVASPTEA